MQSIDKMQILGQNKWSFKAAHAAGPIGQRWVVESESNGVLLLADLVLPAGDKVLTALCSNSLATKGRTTSLHTANVLDANWLADGSYYQIMELSPAALSLKDLQQPLSELRLFEFGRQLVAGLLHMHRKELVHAALAPHSIYMDQGGLRLGEFWSVHNAEASPLQRDNFAVFSSLLPQETSLFMAPEVLSGQPPTRQSDIFSLGAVLFFLLTKESPRAFGAPITDEAVRTALAKAAIKPLSKMRADIAGSTKGLIMSMMDADPWSRPTIFVLEAAFDEFAGRTACVADSDNLDMGIAASTFDGRHDPLKGLTNDLFLGLKQIQYNTTCTIADLYQIYGSVQIAITAGTDQDDFEQWFSVVAHLHHEEHDYLLLSYPPDLYEEVEVKPIVVLRLHNEETVRVISKEEFSLLAEPCKQAVRLQGKPNIDELSQLLGPIPTRN